VSIKKNPIQHASVAIALALLGIAVSPADAATRGRSVQTKFLPIEMNWQAKSSGCAIGIFFFSVGAGIDRATLDRMTSFINRDNSVINVLPYSRGREGEIELCVRADRTQIDRLFKDLKMMIPKVAQGRRIRMSSSLGHQFSN
jgi:hypothetical protein